MKKKLKTKKRNPNDGTLRNVQASNTRDKKLEHNQKLLRGLIDCLSVRVIKLEKQMKHIYDTCFTS